jgi:HK97 gp10 family phage protein
VADIDVTTHGLPELSARLKALSQGMRTKGARAAVRKGAVLVRDKAKAAAEQIDRPETPLKIADNIAVQFAGRTFKRTGDVMFRVGVRGGARQYSNTKVNRRAGRVGSSYKTGGSTFYWRFVEFGTSTVRARPFLRPSIEGNAQQVMDVILGEMRRQLDMFARKGQS